MGAKYRLLGDMSGYVTYHIVIFQPTKLRKLAQSQTGDHTFFISLSLTHPLNDLHFLKRNCSAIADSAEYKRQPQQQRQHLNAKRWLNNG